MNKSPVRVVMIDDDEDDFEIVRDLLLRDINKNYEPIWVNNYNDGLRRLREQKDDIFLVDYNLGEKSGLDLLIEAGGRKSLRKPAILLTGTDSPEVDLSAMEVGATYYMQKQNLGVRDLLERTIRYAIKAARHYDQIRELDRLRIEKEAAQTANESKSRFLASVTHELRTPLAAMLGFTDLALDRPIGEMNGGYLKIIRRNAEHLLNMVNDLLDLSKIEAGKYEVSMSPTDWRATVLDVFETLRISAESKGNRLRYTGDPSLPMLLETDAHALRQILVNLIGNAIKFTKDGDIEVRVEHNDKSFRLLVSDTGIGMENAEQQRLFQPFGQGSSDLKKKFGGTGLGLHISRQIAVALGGTLTLKQSCVGVGSTFELNLPASWATSQIVPPSRMDNDPPSLHGLSILLAEDCEDIQALIQQYLQQAGAKVTTAENGKVAVSLAKANNYDAILMDIQMPGLNGVEATQSLRSSGITTPVIALSANDMDGHFGKVNNSGFTDYLTKPVQMRKLVDTLARYTS